MDVQSSNFNTLPDYMTNSGCRRWLLWRSVPSVKGKPKKIPYYANGKVRCGQLDAQTDWDCLVTFSEALASLRAGNFTGLGFALGPDGRGGNWQGIDLDNISGNPKLSELALPGYVEFSPSMNGLHAIGYGVPFATLGSNGSGIEAYPGGRFFTVTGFGGELASGRKTDAEVVDLADFVSQKLFPLHGGGKNAKPRSKTVKTSRVVASPIIQDATPELIADLKSALSCISADERQVWVYIGQALRTLGDPGYKLWAEWSATSHKFEGVDDLASWETFSADRINYRAVFSYAQECGWINPRRKRPDPATIFGKQLDVAKIESVPSKFLLIPVAQFVLGKSLPWIIKGILPKVELAMIYGPSGSGKTFIVLDWAISIARGVSWCGRKVRQGKVVYIAAEGAGGLKNRIKAHAKHHNIDLNSLPLDIIAATPNLLGEDDVKELVKDIGEASLVIIDTLAQTSAGGDENSSEDMGKILLRGKKLHELTGATILFVHHMGKDAAKGPRGWSGILAAVDVAVEIKRCQDASGLRVARIAKLKDGEDGIELGFRLHTVKLGEDEDGDEINSCIVEFTDVPLKAKKRRWGKWEESILSSVRKLVKDGRVAVSDVIANAISFHPPSEKRDQRASSAKRALMALAEAGCLSIVDDHIVVSGDWG